MKLKIEKSTLLSVVGMLEPIYTSGKLDGFDAVKVEATKEKLVFTTTCGETSIKHTVVPNEENCYVLEEEGIVSVKGKQFGEAVKTVKDGLVTFEAEDKLVILSSGKNRVKLATYRVEDFPNVVFEEGTSNVVIKQMDLNDIIERTTFACSTKETRPVLTGVNFSLKNGTLTCIATDSYRLSKVQNLLPFETDITVTIPKKALDVVKKNLLKEPENDIKLSLTEKAVSFEIEGTVLKTVLLSGGYPDTEKLIPTEFAYTLTGDKEYFIETFSRANFIKNDNISVVKMALSEGGCEISKKDTESEFREDLENIEYKGEPLQISVRSEYIVEALRAIPSKRVVISFNGEMKPFILRGDDDTSVTELALPVRTYN